MYKKLHFLGCICAARRPKFHCVYRYAVAATTVQTSFTFDLFHAITKTLLIFSINDQKNLIKTARAPARLKIGQPTRAFIRRGGGAAVRKM